VKIQYALAVAVATGLGFGNGFETFRKTADATAVEVQFEDGRYFARTENATSPLLGVLIVIVLMVGSALSIMNKPARAAITRGALRCPPCGTT
jgi:hypothetical protein